MIMFGYDVFNAVSLINIPGAPASTTFRDILEGYPEATSGFHSRTYTGPNGYVWTNADLEEDNGNENHISSQNMSDIEDLFEWASGGDSGDWAMLYAGDAFHISGLSSPDLCALCKINPWEHRLDHGEWNYGFCGACYTQYHWTCPDCERSFI